MIRFSVADQIAVNARSYSDRVALEVVDGDGSGPTTPALTYAEAWRRVCGLADALGDVEAGPNGPMVALLLANGADHVLAYLACQAAGAAAVPVNSRLASPEVEYVLKDSGASVLLASEPYLEVAGAAATAVGARLIDAGAVATPAAPTRAVRADATRGEDLALVAYTSGTTGFPKGAGVTNDALLLQFHRWGWQFGLTADQVVLTAGPVFHLSYGGLSLAALLVGARVRVMAAFDPERACDELGGESTWAFLVPSMTAAVVDAWKRRGRPPLESLRFLLSSGAPVPAALLEEAMAAFPRAVVAEAYGWTEGGWVTYEAKDPATLRPHCVGWPTLGSEVVVVDDDGRPCAVGQPGEITVRSVVPFAGYLNRPDATATATTPDGFVRSGDVGVLDADGRLRVVDRKVDMIVSGAENVYSAEVERVLLDHPGVAEAAVVGRPDARWGEAVVAVVVPAQGGDGAEPLAADELQRFCRLHLAAYKCPKDVVVVDALPRNPMGKVQKTVLRDRV